MKRISISMAAILAILVAFSGLNSCGEDNTSCAINEYQGNYMGTHLLAGLLPLDDEITVSIDEDTVILESKILQQTLKGKFDASTGIASVEGLRFERFIIDDDTLFDISVNRGTAQLDRSCDKLYIDLKGVTVQSGTIDLPPIIDAIQPPDGYPIKNVSIETTDEGFVRN